MARTSAFARHSCASRNPGAAFFLCWKQGFHPPAASGSLPSKASVQLRCAGYFWHDSGHPALRHFAASFAVRAAPAAQCPKVTKRLSARRGVSLRIVRSEIPCASRLRRGSLDVRPCTFAHARASCARPSRALTAAACDARHREGRRLFHEPAHPWTAHRRNWLFLLWQDAAKRGPLVARRTGAGTARRVARRRRASLRMYTDVHQANPGACSRTRSTRRRHGCRR